MNASKLTLSFDIGHSSIGWAVFENADGFPNPLGAGTVLFPKDSCLASVRRTFRRFRRNIAVRRSRVARLKKFLQSAGVLSAEQLDENACAFPWFLAARVLASDGEKKLSWQELWSVLRWYAHNRGYDGNALWAGDAADFDESEMSAEDAEDSKKVAAARALMENNGTGMMAETFCAVLGLDPLGEKKSSRIYFKGSNASFPRKTVEKEVREILRAHIGVLPKIDEAFIDALLKDVPAELRSEMNLPARFSKRGGLLFGQSVPRFDNRIIGKCRITGKNVPLKNCREYFLYRWGRLLNNLTVFGIDGNVRVLTPDERRLLDAEMHSRGFFDKRSLNATLEKITHCKPANTEGYFLIPEMEEALVFDPVKKYVGRSMYVKDFWIHFSERGKKIFASQLSKGKVLKLSECVRQMEAWGDWETKAQFDAALEVLKNKEEKKKASKRRVIPDLRLRVKFPKGRASYCKEILRKTYEEALAGTDSTQEGGCLYETPEIRERLLRGNADAGTLCDEAWIAAQTNNHLVRHRLLIFLRLLRDIVAEYAAGDASRVGDVVVEVVRELKEFSGLSAQEISKKLNEKFANFNFVSEKLEKEAKAAGVPVTASLLREARLIEDQNFYCPYTGARLSYNDLLGERLEREHIIPRSLRPSDALSSCVMTFASVNRMKGQRTAMQFMKDFAGKDVPGTNLQIQPLEDFLKWVWNHQRQKLHKGFSEEDRKRCQRRAELLLVEKYEERNADFTERDLTQTSHLNKLAIRLVKRELGIAARHLAGSITGFVRRNLCIDECLVAAVPRMQRAARVGENDSRKLLKSEMRELSHLHHAMDAITQGLTGIFFKTEDWKTLIKRKLNERERLILQTKYPEILNFSSDGKIAMRALPKELLEKITARLKEARVVQHVPAKMHGMSVDQTTWSIVGQDEKTRKISLRQRTTDQKSGRYDASGKRFVKETTEKPALLLGVDIPEGKSGKLQAIKGAVLINGNWGLALDPVPTVIPYFKVFPRIRELRERNGGKPVRLLRNGQRIEVLSGKYKGVWKIYSIKDNAGGIAFDMNQPDKVKAESKTDDTKTNVSLKSLLSAGLKILKTRLTGSPCLTTSLQ